MIRICRHCRAAKVCRPRGLCWSCFYTPGVRDQYPITSKYARRGLGNGFKSLMLPPEPTTAAPGSVEKLAVMAERAEQNYELCHPLDARYPGDPLPLTAIGERELARAS